MKKNILIATFLLISTMPWASADPLPVRPVGDGGGVFTESNAVPERPEKNSSETFRPSNPQVNKSNQPASSTSPKKALSSYKRNHFNLYSLNDEIQVGSYYMDKQIQVYKQKKVPVDPPQHAALKKRVENIVRRLAAVSDKPNLPYEVHIFDKPDIVNAFCMPGGQIGIYTGLFDPKKGLVNQSNDDEIAAVLSHEMAHATLRHVTRQLTSMQGLNLIGGITSSVIGQNVSGQAQAVFNQVFNIGAGLYMPSYTRKHEREADQAGFYYLAKAKFNPQAAVNIWSRAAAKGGTNSTKTHFLASHPASGERAKALREWLPEAQVLAGRK